MSEQKKKRRRRFGRIAFILNAMLFGLSAYSFIEQGEYTYGMINLFVALANVMAIRFSEEHRVDLANGGLMVLTAVAAFITGYEYQQAGTQGLHWVWYLVVVLSFVVAIVFFRKGIRRRRASKIQA
jgi:uncharacterized membrane protein YfcA